MVAAFRDENGKARGDALLGEPPVSDHEKSESGQSTKPQPDSPLFTNKQPNSQNVRLAPNPNTHSFPWPMSFNALNAIDNCTSP